MIAQDVLTSLNENDPRSHAIEELREFAGDDATPEHDHGFWYEIEVEDVIARPVRRMIQSRNFWGAHSRSCADQECARPDRAPVGKCERVGVDEVSGGAQEVEAAGGERLLAVVGKVADDALLALVNRLHVRLRRGYLEPEEASLPREVEHLRGIDECLGRHASLEDA